MAIVTATGAPYELATDSRFRSWAKTIRSAKEIDLSKTGGYALTGEFVKFGSSIALNSGEYLVLAAESGSRKYASYDYRLVTVNGNGEAEWIKYSEIKETITQSDTCDEHKAKSLNSVPFAFALFASIMMSSAQPASDTRIDVAREALQNLTDEERASLFAEFDN